MRIIIVIQLMHAVGGTCKVASFCGRMYMYHRQIFSSVTILGPGDNVRCWNVNKVQYSGAFADPATCISTSRRSCADPGGGGAGGSGPPENHKYIGFLSNTCPDPL